MSAQAGAVGAGALNTELLDVAEAARPTGQPRVPGGRGGEPAMSEPATGRRVENDRGVEP